MMRAVSVAKDRLPAAFGLLNRQQKLLSKDEARRIATNIAKLPDLLSRRQTWGVR